MEENETATQSAPQSAPRSATHLIPVTIELIQELRRNGQYDEAKKKLEEYHTWRHKQAYEDKKQERIRHLKKFSFIRRMIPRKRQKPQKKYLTRWTDEQKFDFENTVRTYAKIFKMRKDWNKYVKIRRNASKTSFKQKAWEIIGKHYKISWEEAKTRHSTYKIQRA